MVDPMTLLLLSGVLGRRPSVLSRRPAKVKVSSRIDMDLSAILVRI